MIKGHASIHIQLIPLNELRVFEHQVRYPERLAHYLELLGMPEHVDAHPGLIMVKPRDFGYEILDGHHRFCALVLSGRRQALCAVVIE